MREIDDKAVQAAGDPGALGDFILEFEPYVLKCASKASKRYITKSDDEWSFAMEAFYSAVKDYSYEKGSFLSFAALVINRRLIDYFRRQKNVQQAEFPINPALFSGEAGEDEEDLPLVTQIAASTAKDREDSLRDEIEAANAQFACYDFSFYDLIACSPKSKKTKQACFAAVSFMISSPLLYEEMRRARALPQKTIEKEAGLPRKILERHRKYIIAAIEILVGDYPFLAEYIRPGKEAQRT